jgi:hypothetical protein
MARLPCPLLADIVAKVFLGWRTKIPRAADAFYARRGEGPYRFIQNRSRTSVTALKSDAAAEKSKDQPWRDFLGCSIFDFCNNIGAKRISTFHNSGSAFTITAGRMKSASTNPTRTASSPSPRFLMFAQQDVDVTDLTASCVRFQQVGMRSESSDQRAGRLPRFAYHPMSHRPLWIIEAAFGDCAKAT